MILVYAKNTSVRDRTLLTYFMYMKPKQNGIWAQTPKPKVQDLKEAE